MNINKLNFCVYKITNKISNKSYIGKTNNLEKRYKDHLNRSKDLEITTKFPNALRKYPEDSWNISILYETNNEDHCYEVEALLVDEYNTFHNGYNSCGGGIGTGSGENHPNFGNRWNWSQEQKDVISGKNSSNFGIHGKNHPRFGTFWSQERKDSISGENHPNFGNRWNWSQEQKDAKSGKNSPMYGTMPWENKFCKSKGLEINWFYLDKVYPLRTKYGYGQKKIYDILVKDYPDIQRSPTSFQNMFRWIEKHGNPRNNNKWTDFHNNF